MIRLSAQDCVSVVKLLAPLNSETPLKFPVNRLFNIFNAVR